MAQSMEMNVSLLRQAVSGSARPALSTLEALYDLVPDGVFVEAGDGEATWCNHRFRMLWDVPCDLIETGQPRALLAHMVRRVRAPARFLDQYRALCLPTRDQKPEAVQLTDGRVLETYCQALPGRDAAERRCVWFFREISQRRVAPQDRIADRMGIYDARLVEALEAAPDAFLLYDRNEALVFANQACARLFPFMKEKFRRGVSLTEILRARLAEARPTTAVPPHRLLLRELAAARAGTGARLIDLENGQRLRQIDRTTPAGEIVTIIADVSASRDVEDALRRAHERLEDALDSSDDEILVYDRDERLVLRNHGQKAASGPGPSILGETYEGYLRRATSDGSINSPGGDGEGYVRQRLEQFRAADGATDLRIADGRWIRLMERPLRDGGRLGIRRDITEAKEREERLIAAMFEARLASKAKSEFLANMSHELRTPLNAIIGFADMMQNEILGPVGNPAYCGYVQDIRASGEHLLSLINTMLDIARIEAGRVEMADETIAIGELVALCLPLVRERAVRGGITLRAEMPADLPQLRVDPLRLKQVLLNLLSNAVKFTESGGSVIVEAYRQPAGGCAIAVRDTGIGMRAEDIPRVFEPFVQVEAAISRQFDGTGLGLAVSKALVEKHGGLLVLESSLGVGTIATIRLPAERVVERKAADS
jgi:signal transduction histidine kinase